MSEKPEPDWKICKNPTFWQWLRENFKEDLKEFIVLPLWEYIIGMISTVTGLCGMIIAILPPTSIIATLLMFALLIFGVLLVLHGAYREKYVWNC